MNVRKISLYLVTPLAKRLIKTFAEYFIQTELIKFKNNLTSECNTYRSTAVKIQIYVIIFTLNSDCHPHKINTN